MTPDRGAAAEHDAADEHHAAGRPRAAAEHGAVERRAVEEHESAAEHHAAGERRAAERHGTPAEHHTVEQPPAAEHRAVAEPRAPERHRTAEEQRDLRRLARLLTMVENDPASAATIVRDLWPRTGAARRVGVTGPPGVGKSTLVDRLVALARADGLTVAVVAVDPSSPFTGGAILGDRIRMLRHSGDPDVYIRSMAAREHQGGLAAATRDAAYVLDAFGFGVVLLETLGVGQGELDVMRAADTVAVVTAPGTGDAIQTLKAGILEIADLLVVNKADRPGARETALQLREMLHLAPARSGWDVPVLSTVATDDADPGAAEVWQAIRRHWTHLDSSGELGARTGRRAEREVTDLVQRALATRLRAALEEHPGLRDIVRQARGRTLDPHSAARAILDALLPEPAAHHREGRR